MFTIRVSVIEQNLIVVSFSLCCNSTVHTLFLTFPMVPQCEIAVWGMAGTPDPSVPPGLVGNGWVRAFFDVLLKDHHGCPGFRLTINQGPLWPAGLSRVWFMSAGEGRASDSITPPHLYHPHTHTHTHTHSTTTSRSANGTPKQCVCQTLQVSVGFDTYIIYISMLAYLQYFWAFLDCVLAPV